jgi:acetyl esterase/lipase
MIRSGGLGKGAGMGFRLDDELEKGLMALNEKIGDVPEMAVGDVESRRRVYDPLQRTIFEQLPVADDVMMTDCTTTSRDGAQILMRWYTKKNARRSSAVLYIPGGGMICSGMDIYDRPVALYVAATGVPFLSVEYRRAPEHLAPTQVEDCYAALVWLLSQADELGIDPNRVAIMGDSGGGGVAASLAIYARDNDLHVARQILIYPMLDDRNLVPDDHIAPFAAWTYEDNRTGWGALLGESVGGPDVSPYAAAARLKDFSGLPPAYVEVGELDIFRDESIAYAQRLLAAGISTELHVHPGAPHAFEAFVPAATVSRRALGERHRIVRAL